MPLLTSLWLHWPLLPHLPGPLEPLSLLISLPGITCSQIPTGSCISAFWGDFNLAKQHSLPPLHLLSHFLALLFSSALNHCLTYDSHTWFNNWLTAAGIVNLGPCLVCHQGPVSVTEVRTPVCLQCVLQLPAASLCLCLRRLWKRALLLCAGLPEVPWDNTPSEQSATKDSRQPL